MGGWLAQYARANAETVQDGCRGEAIMKRTCKLTDRDVELIAQLKSIRAELIRQARNLTDQILAEKFECSKASIERIPAAES